MRNEKLQTVYEYILESRKNVRIPIRRFHKKTKREKGARSISRILEDARLSYILVGPFVYANTGTEVELILREENHDIMFEDWKKCTSDPSVTYAVLLSGTHTLLIFRNGANILSFADSIIPTFPRKAEIPDLQIKERGKLEKDPFPHGWDEIDWEIFEIMRNPLVSFLKVAEIIRQKHKEDEYRNVTWQTIRNRFNKVIRDCKTWISFFPQGLYTYYHTFLSFKTEYEIGVYNELRKLDRTSYIYKFEDTLMLFVYIKNFEDQKFFLNLQKEGIIHDLRVSTPVEWYKNRVSLSF